MFEKLFVLKDENLNNQYATASSDHAKAGLESHYGWQYVVWVTPRFDAFNFDAFVN